MIFFSGLSQMHSLEFVRKNGNKKLLTNVISTKIMLHFCCFMGCYWLSSPNEESFLPDKFREMRKQSNSSLRTPGRLIQTPRSDYGQCSLSLKKALTFSPNFNPLTDTHP